MLKLVNRTRRPPVVDLLFARTFATLPLVFASCMSSESSLAPPLSRWRLRLLRRELSSNLSLPPQTPSGSDNGGLALSSWFIASFDSRVHDSVSPTVSFTSSLRTNSIPYSLSLSLSPLVCSLDFQRFASCRMPLHFPYRTYSTVVVLS